MKESLGLGAGGGLLAGSAVGLFEAVWVLSQAPSGEYLALVYAAFLYGLVGLGLGLFVGGTLVAAGRRWAGLSAAWSYTVSALSVIVTLGSWVLAHQLNRAIYLELGLGTQGRLVIVVLMTGLSVVMLWLGPVFLTRTPLKMLLHARGTVVAWGCVVGLASLFALSPGPSAGDVALAPQRSTQADLGDTPDLVLITVESLRLDTLPLAQDALPLTQHTLPQGAGSGQGGLQRLVDEGVSFRQHVATSTWMRPSVASLLTGQLPAAHGVDVVAARLAEDRLTLQEILQGRGYVTGDLPARPELETALGFGQGFDWLMSYGEARELRRSQSVQALSLPSVLQRGLWPWQGPVVAGQLHRTAGALLGAARAFIQANRAEGNRYMLWIHLAEPSQPYFRAAQGGVVEHRAASKLDQAARDDIVAAYGDEVARVDQALAELLSWMDQQGALEDALVVLVGTNGEELFEHGGWGSGDTVYDEQLLTPLVFKLPGGRLAGATLPWQVSTIDIAPTILGLTGTTVPDAMEGRNLLDEETLAWLAGAQESGPELPPAVSQLHRRGVVMESFRAPPWKLVRARAGNGRGVPVRSIFDLKADPGEHVNLAGQTGAREPQLSRALRERLARSASWRTRPAVARP